MPHFAKLNENNIVVFVTVGREEDDGKEDELTARTGDVYKQTSFNTRSGVYYDPKTGKPSKNQSKAFRGTYAGVGFHYNEELNIFYPPQPYASWTLNPQIASWEPPVDYPLDGNSYVWDEQTLSWVLPEIEEDGDE